MRKSLLILIVCFLYPVPSRGQMVKIGLYNSEVIHSLVVNCTNGEYLLMNGEERIAEFQKGDILFAALNGEDIQLHSQDEVYGLFQEVELRSLNHESTFRIRPVIPSLESRTYDDDLILSSKQDYMSIINKVDIDKYIAGVLESEVGANAHEELYKAHALLTRTYLLRSYNKHRDEGFSLCDGVHCQAYKGRAQYNPLIAKAVFETSGEVVADFHYKLINAVYHSNSGGETQRASDVWVGGRDYLQAVMDPHSLHQPNSKWYDTIFYDDWKKYLLDNGMKSATKVPEELLYVQQRHRKKYFILDKDTLLFTKIREDWNFRSTFFNMFPEVGGRIVIWGKGYGHGVGLSQEGAMKMADLGFNYKDIIQFYFYNVRIMNYDDLPASSIPDLD